MDNLKLDIGYDLDIINWKTIIYRIRKVKNLKPNHTFFIYKIRKPQKRVFLQETEIPIGIPGKST